MTSFVISGRSIVTLFLASVAVCHIQAQSKSLAGKKPGSAIETLHRYVQLRLRNANWKDYSRFVTWPDEPGWDCNWVVDKYNVGAPAKRAKNVENIIVPVEYKRLGLFCYDFEFTLEPKRAAVDYELVRSPQGWKIKSPIPDYPDISAKVLLQLLRKKAENKRESPRRQAQFRATVRKLEAALGENSSSHHIRH